MYYLPENFVAGLTMISMCIWFIIMAYCSFVVNMKFQG